MERNTQAKPYTEDDDLITWINKELKRAKSHCQDWRKKTKECYDFFAGDQWTEEEKHSMEEKGRAPVVFNRIARTINSVAGLEVQNRQEVRYIPRENSDTGVNDVLTAAAKWVRDNCDAEDEESEAFQDTLIGGMGWTETWIDYDSDPDGQVKIDRVDSLDFLWDPDAKKRNLDDARWKARFKKIPRSEFDAMWPEATPDKNAVDLDMDLEEPHDADEAKFYRENNSDQPDGKGDIVVVQFQWWERGTYYMVQQSNGKVLELSDTKYKKLKDQIESMGLKVVKRTKRLYKRAFVNGNQILEEGEAPCKDNFSFRCITGLRNRNDNTWFGIVELMKDPQRWANKWLSQIMFIINTNAKGGLLAEETAVKNVRKFEEDWSKPDSVTWLNQGGLEKVKEKGQAQYPEGLDRLLQYALSSINDVPGVNLELLGLADRQQAGYLEAQRKQAGVTILAIFFDALRRYRKEQGRVLAYFIKEYIADGRLIRILEKGQEQYVPLLRDSMTYTYDVIVDDAPTSPNMKEKVFGIIQQLLGPLMQAGVPVPPDLLDYTPLPESMVKKWKEYIEEQSNKPPPPDPRVEAEKAKLQLKAQELQMTTQAKQQEAMLDAQLKQQQTASEIQIGFEKLRAEMAIDRERMFGELQIAMQKVVGELRIKDRAEQAKAKQPKEKKAA